VNGKISVPLPEYEKNLDQLVEQLKATGATLIWANTTLVPEDEMGRNVGDDTKYNEVAARVMQKHGVAINDLHKLSAAFEPEMFIKPRDVHYTPAGSQKLAEQVVAKISELLGEKK
jgi:lysophospholipase L1-like esterase